jgi:hypothetical protein
VAVLERRKRMLRSFWSALRVLAALLGQGPHPEDLLSSEPDLGHGMDPNG